MADDGRDQQRALDDQGRGAGLGPEPGLPRRLREPRPREAAVAADGHAGLRAAEAARNRRNPEPDPEPVRASDAFGGVRAMLEATDPVERAVTAAKAAKQRANAALKAGRRGPGAQALPRGALRARRGRRPRAPGPHRAQGFVTGRRRRAGRRRCRRRRANPCCWRRSCA